MIRNQPSSSERLVMLPGLAADATVLSPQKLAFPSLTIPDWLRPSPDESLHGYCKRFAERLRPFSPTIIGGASAGGIFALELARHLRPAAVILIGSVREPAELPRRIRYLRPLRHGTALIPIRSVQWSAGPATRSKRPHLAGVARQLHQADPIVLKWSFNQVLQWRSSPELSCPVYKIHGEKDHVFPLACTQPDAVVEGGGHLISLTHGREVNQFMRACLKRHS